MPKGMFTQGVCVLLESSVSLQDVADKLSEFEIVKRVDASEEWVFSGPALIVAFQPASNGYVSIDVVDRPWPDQMGDPKKEAMLFGAWSMGHFGPFSYPGGLERAGQQSWDWEPGRTIADQHSAFIRIRFSYAFGAEETDPVIPEDYEPMPELHFAMKLVSNLLDVPGALCYFNPNGELLAGQDGLRETLNHGWANDVPPLDAWANVRLFNINEQWCMMDTVGNGQLDLPDSEACFQAESYDMNQVESFLLNVSLYLLNNGEIIRDGDTMDGPGDIRWQCRHAENGLCDPPRSVLRWFPMDERPVPPEILSDDEPEE